MSDIENEQKLKALDDVAASVARVLADAMRRNDQVAVLNASRTLMRLEYEIARLDPVIIKETSDE